MLHTRIFKVTDPNIENGLNNFVKTLEEEGNITSFDVVPQASGNSVMAVAWVE